MPKKKQAVDWTSGMSVGDAIRKIIHFNRYGTSDIQFDLPKGMEETPARVIKSFAELFAGYDTSPRQIFTVFDEPCDEMVVLRDVEFFSTCEHHLLPFFGVAHIAYIPNKKVLGASKLARVLDMFARRYQIQERICRQVTQCLTEHLKPKGAACLIEAKHLCISCRGVQKQSSVFVTSSLEGVFKKDHKTRSEFLTLVKS